MLTTANLSQLIAALQKDGKLPAGLTPRQTALLQKSLQKYSGEVSQRLLGEFGMYATPINYPTVMRGEERLRLTPGPLHSDAMMDELVQALTAIIPAERRRAA